MSLSFVGGLTGSPAGSQGTNANAAFNVSLTALTGGTGSTANEGDLVIAVYGNATVGSNTNQGVTTSGYAQIADVYSDDTLDANLTVYWKIMGSTPDTTVAFAASGNSAWGCAALVHVWRGVDSTNPIDVTTTTASGINTDAFNSPSITPTTPGAYVLTIGAGTNDITNDDTITAPAGYGNQKNVSRLATSYAITIGCASKAWITGAEDPAVWGGLAAGAANAWCAASVALRPAIVFSPSASFFY